MSAPLRSGGRAILANGAVLVWSMAAGARGRRWREAVSLDGRLVRSLLLEVSAAGRPTRLEMTTPAGLLTLHPGADERELHGNVVTPHGVRHLRFAWSAGHELFVVDSRAAAAVALGRLSRIHEAGEAPPVAVVRVDDGLAPEAATANREAWTTILDDDGMPILPNATTWPLEAD